MESESSGRQQFSSKLGFLLSAIGSAVGLGNIWRYPYVAYKNGGGAFLVPYFIALFTAAIPLLILEYIIGTKYRGATPLAFARIKKKYEFIGWIPTIVAGMIIFYYSVVLSWAGNYTLFSFSKAWGADAGDFFYNKFLNLPDLSPQGTFSIGSINMPIIIGLAVVWFANYLVLSKDISEGLEKTNKVLLPLMVVSMLCIVIRGVTLPNAAVGLNKLFTPDWSAVTDASVWVAAYGQVFFSLSVAMGIMVTYSSYLPKGTELVNTSFIAGLSNSAFEFTVAIGVFGILGFMAGTPETFDTVVKQGPGLAFEVFPTGINLMPGISGTIIGILFFLCLVSAGFTSFISLTEAFSAPFMEKYKIGRKKVFAVTCLLGFCASTLFATDVGLYILDMVDYTCNSYGLTIVGILEAVACGWMLKRLPEFIEYANKTSYYKLGAWWSICVRYILPLVVFGNLAVAFYSFIKDGYDAYSTSMLAIYCGGTALIVVSLVIFFSIVKWPAGVPVEDYTEEE